MNPKIVVFVGDTIGCGYYRAILPYRQLTHHGFDVLVCNEFEDKNTQDADLIVLQRQHGDVVLSSTEKFRSDHPGSKIIFEFDDNVHAIPRSNGASNLYRTGTTATKNIERFLGLADAVTVSTEPLKREYIRYNENIHVCHNAVDPDLLQDVLDTEERHGKCECNVVMHMHHPRAEDEFRLAWAGSATHVDDVKTVIKPIVETLQEFPHVTLLLFGHNLIGMLPQKFHARCRYLGETFPRDKKGNAMQMNLPGENNVLNYYKLLRQERIDAAIAPLEHYLFNSCKSFIKLIEYSVAQIPFVATRFGPYQQYMSLANGKQVGLTADSSTEWRRALRDIITKPDLRKRLVENNYEFIKSNHLVPHRSHEWLTALASVGIMPGSKPGVYEEKVVKP